MRIINTALEGKKFLLGDEVSLADIILASSLMYAFQTCLDGGYRKSVKNVDAWAAKVYALPEMEKVHGKVALAAKALKPVCTAEKKAEPKKKVAEQPKAEKPKKEEKPKDNVESLPPTPFDLYSFKTFFINHKD